MTSPDDATASSTVLLPLAAASSRLGISVDALRSRIRRGVLTARRGNDGRLLVAVAAEAGLSPELVTGSPNDELVAEIGDLREALARAEAERDAAVTIGEAKVAAIRELADELKAQLAELRRPWWRRWIQ